MITILQSLQAINAYPVPDMVLALAATEFDLSPDDAVTSAVRELPAYKCAKARVYQFLAEAPNISQGGVTYSFTAEDKALFKAKANELVAEAEAGNSSSGVEYGWDGENF